MANCKDCSGDGWLYHSKGGQGGNIRTCYTCDGSGYVTDKIELRKDKIKSIFKDEKKNIKLAQEAINN